MNFSRGKEARAENNSSAGNDHNKHKSKNRITIFGVPSTRRNYKENVR